MKYLKNYEDKIITENTTEKEVKPIDATELSTKEIDQLDDDNTDVDMWDISDKLEQALDTQYNLDDMKVKEYYDKYEYYLNPNYSIFVNKKDGSVLMKWSAFGKNYEDKFTDIDACIKKLLSK